MTDNKWNVIDITERTEIPFQWKDPTPGGQSLGRAEFEVCIHFKRRKVVEYWVYPRQQRQEDAWHYIGGNGYGDFAINSVHLDQPRVWLTYWCKLHKCQCLRMYVPDNSSILVLDHNGITFR